MSELEKQIDKVKMDRLLKEQREKDKREWKRLQIEMEAGRIQNIEHRKMFYSLVDKKKEGPDISPEKDLAFFPMITKKKVSRKTSYR